MIAQGAWQRAYVIRENNSLRLKHKIYNNKLIKYERFKKMKHIRYCNIIPSDFSKWVFLDQTETIFDEMKTISQWKRCSGCNGIDPIGQKYIENLEPKTLLKFR